MDLIRLGGHFWAQHAVKESMMARRKQHRDSSKVKTEALQLPAETDEPITKIARELGVSAKTSHDGVECATLARGAA
jgi:transposase-like protein